MMGFITMSNYRKYKKGDTIRVTGFQGRLFGSCCKKKLADGVELGVECVLTKGEDDEHDVLLPEGILANGAGFLSVACIELVTPVEETVATIEHNEECSVFNVCNADDTRCVARIWYDGGLPKEVAEKFAKDIKAAWDAANQA